MNRPLEQIRKRAADLAQSRPVEFWLLLLCVALVAFYGVVYPNAGLVLESFQTRTGWSIDSYAQTLAQPSTQRAIVVSLLLSLGTVAGCALVGVPLALLVDRVEVPGRRFVAAIVASPMLLPPLVGTIAFIFLFSESGIVTRAVMRAFSLAEAPYRLRGFWAVLLFHIYTIYPYFFVFVGSALARSDPALEEAARTLGASRWTRFRRIVFPSISGALASAAILTFMTSMASFSAPYLFGGDARVLTQLIYDAKINNERGIAVVITVILAALSAVALVVFARAETRVPVGAGSKGVTRRRVALSTPLARSVAVATCVVVAVILLMPHATIALLSVAKIGTWTTQVLPPDYTLANYAKVFSGPRFLNPVRNSAVMAAISAIAALAFGVASAYLLTRYRFRARWVLVVLLLVPWSLPGTVLAFQIVEAFTQPSFLTAGQTLAGSFWLLPAIYFLRNMPLVMRAAQVNLQQLDPSLESAARSLGATWLATMRRVVLPLIAPGAIAGALLAFALGLGEFVASIVAYVLSNRPISIQIEQSMRQGDLGTAAAYGTILVLAVGAALAWMPATSRQTGQN